MQENLNICMHHSLKQLKCSMIVYLGLAGNARIESFNLFDFYRSKNSQEQEIPSIRYLKCKDERIRVKPAKKKKIKNQKLSSMF